LGGLVALALLLFSVVSAGAAGPAPACASGSCTVSFGYAGSSQTWTVPPGVSSASTVDVFGAQGGPALSGGMGGLGSELSATSVPLSGMATITVGGAGTTSNGVSGGGFNGGGNGRATAGGGGGFTQFSDGVVLIAGGGGGGGNAGSGPSSIPAGGDGGAGATAGSPGADVTADGATLGGGGGGGAASGGTVGSGGAAGTVSGTSTCSGGTGNGEAGSPGTGTTGGEGAVAAGGGGGGYAGGGGGGEGSTDLGCGDTAGSAGGGGGSSHAAGAGTPTVTDAVRAGSGQVTITYADPITATGQSYTVATNGTLTRSASTGVSSSGAASAPSGDALTAAVTSAPAHGAVTLNADGSFTYTPASGYGGGDSFDYRLSDASGDFATATASITVTPLPPTAAISAPAANATYAIGASAAEAFSCSEGAGGSGISSCVDGAGQAGGSALDTSTIGTHTLTVTATSKDGQTGSASVTYYVVGRPSPRSAPVLSGSARVGGVLSCAPGGFTGPATSYLYGWERNRTPIAGASKPTYTVVALDQGSSLRCVVVAGNAAGYSTPAASNAVVIAVLRVAGCPAATGHAAGTQIGLVRLGFTRAHARRVYTHSSRRGRSYQDFFCLEPIGIRTGYASPKLLRTLPVRLRARYTGTVIWISTSSPRYSIRGVQPGASVAAAGARLKLGRAFHIGLNDWYLAPDGPATAVLKVRGGVVQEIGIAVKRLTGGSRGTQRRFLTSFE
jgi:hypothetical protein